MDIRLRIASSFRNAQKKARWGGGRARVGDWSSTLPFFTVVVYIPERALTR
jgi:hypothetical protein